MRSWPVTGWSATELSATDASAEPLPVIKVNVWTSLYAPWARNPMCGPGRRGWGACRSVEATGAASSEAMFAGQPMGQLTRLRMVQSFGSPNFLVLAETGYSQSHNRPLT
jgi:hypothetical protein